MTERESELEEKLLLTQRYLDWCTGDDVGVSSATIFHVATGVRALRSLVYDAPYDASDFGRCRRLVKLFPEFEAKLPEVASLCPQWAPIVEEWQGLCALYDAGAGLRDELNSVVRRLRRG